MRDQAQRGASALGARRSALGIGTRNSELEIRNPETGNRKPSGHARRVRGRHVAASPRGEQALGTHCARGTGRARHFRQHDDDDRRGPPRMSLRAPRRRPSPGASARGRRRTGGAGRTGSARPPDRGPRDSCGRFSCVSSWHRRALEAAAPGAPPAVDREPAAPAPRDGQAARCDACSAASCVALATTSSRPRACRTRRAACGRPYRTAPRRKGRETRDSSADAAPAATSAARPSAAAAKRRWIACSCRMVLSSDRRMRDACPSCIAAAEIQWNASQRRPQGR